MTANNGVYYLDTAVGATQQTSEPFTSPVPITASNVFQAGQTYYVYFLYAKPDTTQTIQVYVGPGFCTSTTPPCTKSDVQGVRIIPNGWPLITSNVTVGSLPTGWTSSYDGNILTVTTNFSGLSDIVPSAASGLCMPSSFCAVSSTGSCECALSSTDPLHQQCQAACSYWAVEDLDFPPAGAYGFAFTLPSGFTTAPYNASALGPPNRPAPTPFPTTPSSSPNWLTQFVRTTVAPDNASGGQCYYGTIPGSGCAVTYPNPTSN